MVDEVKAAEVKPAPVNTDGACEDARKDADAIREVFSQQGIQEAYALLTKERQNAKALGSTAEQDTWEQEMVMALGGKTGGKDDLLPALSLAYLDANKAQFTDIDDDDEYDVREVSNRAQNMFSMLDMEKAYGRTENKVDDLEVALLGNAKELLRKNDFNGEDVREIEEIEELLADNKKQAATEFSFQKTRDLNKQLAETLTKNQKLFNLLDEENSDAVKDGKITETEVENFLSHAKRSKDFKDLFTAEEFKTVEDLKKTFGDENNAKDEKGTFIKGEVNYSWLGMIQSVEKSITKDSIKTTLGGEGAVAGILKAAGEAAAAAGKLVGEQAKQKEGETPETADANKDKEQDKDTTVDAKEGTNPEQKEGSTAEQKEGNSTEPKEDTQDTETASTVDAETQMVNDAVQRAGEGPYQVATRLLKGKNDPAAVAALTKILKEQLVENTQSQDYAEAVTKLEVGHQFFTCEGLEQMRQKVAASGNQTLIQMFGSPVTTTEAAATESTKK